MRLHKILICIAFMYIGIFNVRSESTFIGYNSILEYRPVNTLDLVYKDPVNILIKAKTINIPSYRFVTVPDIGHEDDDILIQNQTLPTVATKSKVNINIKDLVIKDSRSIIDIIKSFLFDETLELYAGFLDGRYVYKINLNLEKKSKIDIVLSKGVELIRVISTTGNVTQNCSDCSRINTTLNAGKNKIVIFTQDNYKSNLIESIDLKTVVTSKEVSPNLVFRNAYSYNNTALYLHKEDLKTSKLLSSSALLMANPYWNRYCYGKSFGFVKKYIAQSSNSQYDADNGLASLKYVFKQIKSIKTDSKVFLYFPNTQASPRFVKTPSRYNDLSYFYYGYTMIDAQKYPLTIEVITDNNSESDNSIIAYNCVENGKYLSNMTLDGKDPLVLSDISQIIESNIHKANGVNDKFSVFQRGHFNNSLDIGWVVLRILNSDYKLKDVIDEKYWEDLAVFCSPECSYNVPKIGKPQIKTNVFHIIIKIILFALVCFALSAYQFNATKVFFLIFISASVFYVIRVYNLSDILVIFLFGLLLSRKPAL